MNMRLVKLGNLNTTLLLYATNNNDDKIRAHKHKQTEVSE